MDPTRPEGRTPAIRVLMMPRDTNAHGTIFGGVILSHIDQAGAVIDPGRQPCFDTDGRCLQAVLDGLGTVSFTGREPHLERRNVDLPGALRIQRQGIAQSLPCRSIPVFCEIDAAGFELHQEGARYVRQNPGLAGKTRDIRAPNHDGMGANPHNDEGLYWLWCICQL